ncbi:hypothetical protein TNCV_5087821 [Trichonephila clavipes]|nr:hypothetical protein TNCV_5087821 [Trichonephila clavipes]
MSESGEVHQTTSLDEDHDRDLPSPLFINPFTSRLFQLASLLRSVLFLVLLPYRCHLAILAAVPQSATVSLPLEYPPTLGNIGRLQPIDAQTKSLPCLRSGTLSGTVDNFIGTLRRTESGNPTRVESLATACAEISTIGKASGHLEDRSTQVSNENPDGGRGPSQGRYAHARNEN